MPALATYALAGLLSLGLPFGPPTSNLRADEELRLFPALAFPATDGGWEVHARAWVFEPEEGSWWRGLALDALRRALGLPAGSEANAYFLLRARGFLVDNERNKWVVIRFGGADHRLPPTAADGHTEARLRVEPGALRRGETAVAAVLRGGDDRHFEGTILRLDPGGLSVVSDIDDTIKISEVRDLPSLLANTFLRPFAAVAELPQVYQRWAAAGATFHYVSASPWHLYDPLREFIVAAGYPLGSFHLKDFRWKDRTFLSLVQDPESYKLATIEPLVVRAAGRRFALVGDSGEADPEAYAELFRRHPDQIVHIYIRDVTGEGRDASRYQATFAGVPIDRWTIFTDARELPLAPPRAPAASP
ncbi:MAG: App1 family protein [Nannocystaceae bacterium]